MIELYSYFNSVKSIVCLNGAIPDAIFFQRQAHLPLLAADGAGHQLVKMGIIPNTIIGDFDSLDMQFISRDTEIIHITEQNTTDFEKVLQVVEQRNLFPCLVYGATGKESDHTLHNLHVIAEKSLKYPIIFHDSAYSAKEKYGIFVNDYFTAALNINAKVSLLAFIPSVVSTKGLTWELDHMQLAPRSSTRNSVQASPIEITVHNGNALVLFDWDHSVNLIGDFFHK